MAFWTMRRWTTSSSFLSIRASDSLLLSDDDGERSISMRQSSPEKVERSRRGGCEMRDRRSGRVWGSNLNIREETETWYGEVADVILRQDDCSHFFVVLGVFAMDALTLGDFDFKEFFGILVVATCCSWVIYIIFLFSFLLLFSFRNCITRVFRKPYF